MCLCRPFGRNVNDPRVVASPALFFAGVRERKGKKKEKDRQAGEEEIRWCTPVGKDRRSCLRRVELLVLGVGGPDPRQRAFQLRSQLPFKAYRMFTRVIVWARQF